MGRTYFVSGGVSLASRSDISAKMRKSRKTTQESAASRLNRPGRASATSAKKFNAKTKGPKTSFETTAKNNSFGEITAKVDGRTLKLVWHKNEGAVLDEYVNSLVEIENNAPEGRRGENMFKGLKGIEKLVRVEAGKKYLVSSKFIAGRWIYIEINPAADKKSQESIYTAAGTEPDSDIFRAKTIAAAQAQQLISAKTSVTLIP